MLAANMWNQDTVRPCYFLCCSKLSFLPSRYLEICSELKIDKTSEELLGNVFVAELPTTEHLVNTINKLAEGKSEVCFYLLYLIIVTYFFKGWIGLY